jgi:Fe-S-cluster containining protein
VSCCAGKCCAAFPYTTTPEKLQKRWQNVRRPLTKREAGWERDDLYIADMLIELPHEEVMDLGQEFDLWKAIDNKPDGSYPMYTCRHWDPSSKLCMAYEKRPRMCAEFPYDKSCEHGCGARAEPHTQIKWLAIRVKQVASK